MPPSDKTQVIVIESDDEPTATPSDSNEGRGPVVRNDRDSKSFPTPTKDENQSPTFLPTTKASRNSLPKDTNASEEQMNIDSTGPSQHEYPSKTSEISTHDNECDEPSQPIVDDRIPSETRNKDGGLLGSPTKTSPMLDNFFAPACAQNSAQQEVQEDQAQQDIGRSNTDIPAPIATPSYQDNGPLNSPFDTPFPTTDNPAWICPEESASVPAQNDQGFGEHAEHQTTSSTIPSLMQPRHPQNRPSLATMIQERMGRQDAANRIFRSIRRRLQKNDQGNDYQLPDTPSSVASLAHSSSPRSIRTLESLLYDPVIRQGENLALKIKGGASNFDRANVDVDFLVSQLQAVEGIVDRDSGQSVGASPEDYGITEITSENGVVLFEERSHRGRDREAEARAEMEAMSNRARNVAEIHVDDDLMGAAAADAPPEKWRRLMGSSDEDGK